MGGIRKDAAQTVGFIKLGAPTVVLHNYPSGDANVYHIDIILNNLFFVNYVLKFSVES